MIRNSQVAVFALALATAAMIRISDISAAQLDPSVTRSLEVQSVEAKRSRIVAVVGTVPLPQAGAALSADQHSQLRDAAVLEAKKAALQRVITDLGPSAATPPSLDDVYLVQLTELPVDNSQYKVLVKAEVRYVLASASASPTPAAAPITTQTAAPSSVSGGAAAASDTTAANSTSAPSAPTPSAGDTSQLPSLTDNSAAAPAANAPTVMGSLTAPDSSSGASVATSSASAPDGSSTPPAAPVSGGPLTVRLWTDRTSYQDNEQMVVHVNGNRDFYGRIVYHDVAGNDIQILPNDFRKDAQFKANTEVVVPGDADKFQLMVKAPFGSERITIYASTAPQGDVPTQPMANGLAVVRASPPETARLTRSLAIVPRDPAAVASLAGAAPPTSQANAPLPDSGEMYEATWNVTTISK